MYKFSIFLFLGLILILSPLNAQDNDLVERFLDDLQTDEIGETDFLQILKDLEDNPININNASTKKLLRIPFLSYEVARELIKYRKAKGNYSNYKDLLNVPGVSGELVTAITPYIQFHKNVRKGYFNYRFQAGEHLHDIRGYREEDKYKNPLYILHRLQWQPIPTLRVSVIWEKDAGESDWFDFGSFSLNYKWTKGKSEVLIGDYNLESGQRLVLSGPYGQAVAVSNPVPFTRTPLRWNIKTSVNENAFLRGFLWDFSPDSKSSIIFGYSNRNLDATLTADSSTVSSFYLSGYHRTNTEINKRNIFKEKIYTAIAGKDFSNLHLGLQAVHTDYSLPLSIENYHSKSTFNYYSGFYSYQSGLIRFNGEATFLDGKFPAVQNSFFLKGKNFMYGVIFYYYHPEYWSFHGRAFGSFSSSPNNELGYYFTFLTRPFSKTEVACYYFLHKPIRTFDLFPFLKRTFQIQIRQNYRQSIFTLRYTLRIRENEAGIINSEMKTNAIRLQIEELVSPRLRFRQRLELSWMTRISISDGGNTDYGVSFYIDVRYKVHNRISIQGRWTQFEVPDYDLRLYEFENDLPGTFRNVLLNGRGYKWFLLFNYKFTMHWNFSLKFQEVHFPDAKTLGSGLNTVFGNTKQFIRAQIQLIY